MATRKEASTGSRSRLSVASSGRVNASEDLERVVEERTRELAALVQMASAMTSMLKVGPLMELLLDNLRSVTQYDGAGISLREGDRLRQLAVRRPPGFPTAAEIGAQTERIDYMGEAWELLSKGQSFIVQDTRGPEPIAVAYRESWGGRPRGNSR